MTVSEVAAALRVTPETVLRWIRTGRLEGVALPSGRYRIPRTAVDALTREAS